MATLSSIGVGSGLDVNAIISQLMAIERRPIQQLESASKRLEGQLSAYGRLQSAMAAMRDAARRLGDASTWEQTAVASGDAAAVSARAGANAPPGTYTISVARLAAAQTVVSPRSYDAATAAVGQGTLSVELGRWSADGSSFEADASRPPVTIAIAAGSTLAQARDAINAAGAGVTASIVNDASGARLALRSTTTGAENGFRISADDTDPGSGATVSVAEFAYGGGGGGLTQTLAAADAEATINGVAVTSATNVLTDVLDGLTLTLGRAGPDPVELTVERDTGAMRTAITDFATAYNDLVGLLREQTRFDETTQQAGTLQGDRSAVGLVNRLRSIVGGATAAATAFSRLADIGLEPQSDGKLRVVDARLDAALGRLDELRDFFARNAEGTAQDGFGVLLRDYGDGTLGSEGVLTARQDALRAGIDRNGERIDRLEDRLALVEARLRRQYTLLDENVSRLNGLQNYVSQQIQNWNRSST
ncbi:MAG: flagellar filament capping protein FliD [Rubrivivax sp.]|jgi:flagellar hook-associated protein 2|nr:flagellar filament capping protein FliD [Rubrivivax sp.]